MRHGKVLSYVFFLMFKRLAISTHPKCFRFLSSASNGLKFLPDATTTDTVSRVQVGGSSVTLDAMGPVIVNRDGSISRISNWDTLTDIEKETTLRLIGKRNRIRRLQIESQTQSAENCIPKIQSD